MIILYNSMKIQLGREKREEILKIYHVLIGIHLVYMENAVDKREIEESKILVKIVY